MDHADKLTGAPTSDAPRNAAALRAAEVPARPAYPVAAATPTQQGPKGIRFDFNLGARVSVPEGSWRVQLRDLDTGNILFETNSTGGTFVNSTKRYYLRCAIEAWQSEASVFRHEYSAAGRDVLIQFPVGTLGDLV